MSEVFRFLTRKENRHLVILAMLLTCLLTLGGIESGLGMFSTSTLKTINRRESDDSMSPEGFNGILISSNLTSVQQDQFAFRLHLSFAPKGSYLDPTDPLSRLLSQPVSISIDSTVLSFHADNVILSLDNSLSIQNGNPDGYPFDGYQSSFYIQCFSNSQNSSESSVKEGIPVSLSVSNSLQDWKVDISIVAVAEDFSLLQVKLEVTRAPLQKFFSIFIVILMWLISTGILWMAWSHYYMKKRVDAPTMGVATSMLFALPAVRNMQPGTPVIGCTSDIVGFFWNMAFVAIASLMLIYRFSVQKPVQEHYHHTESDMTLPRESTTKMPPSEEPNSYHLQTALSFFAPSFKKQASIEMSRLIGEEECS